MTLSSNLFVEEHAARDPPLGLFSPPAQKKELHHDAARRPSYTTSLHNEMTTNQTNTVVSTPFFTAEFNGSIGGSLYVGQGDFWPPH